MGKARKVGSQRLKVTVFSSLCTVYVRCGNVRLTSIAVKRPMNESSPKPRTRRRRGSLSREVILDAAQAVAAHGFAPLSMRAVAARLGAVPMALYNHFATKEQLVDALLDRVLGRFAPPPPSEDWIEDLQGFARAHRRLLVEHPWAVAPLFTQP